MATIDIRNEGTVDRIRFNDQQVIYRDKGGNNILVEGAHVAARVPNEDVHSLIKALQKAIELGWAE